MACWIAARAVSDRSYNIIGKKILLMLLEKKGEGGRVEQTLRGSSPVNRILQLAPGVVVN